MFFSVLPTGCLEINDKMEIPGKKALALGNNIFDAVPLVFRACEEILGIMAQPSSRSPISWVLRLKPYYAVSPSRPRDEDAESG